jgi:hypothetical protein
VPRSQNFAAELRDECLNGEIFYSLKEATAVIEQWRNQYNTIRPHSSLNYRPPAPQTSTALSLHLDRSYPMQSIALVQNIRQVSRIFPIRRYLSISIGLRLFQPSIRGRNAAHYLRHHAVHSELDFANEPSSALIVGSHGVQVFLMLASYDTIML